MQRRRRERLLFSLSQIKTVIIKFSNSKNARYRSVWSAQSKKSQYIFSMLLSSLYM